MRRRLIGNQIGSDTACMRAFNQFRQHLCGIAQQAYRNRLSGRRVLLDQGDSFIQIFCLFIEIARTQTKIQATLLTLYIQRNRAGQCRR